MTTFHVIIYADGLVLPLVVRVKCRTRNLTDRLERIFALDFAATIWDGSTMIMLIDAGGIAALRRVSRESRRTLPHRPCLH